MSCFEAFASGHLQLSVAVAGGGACGAMFCEPVSVCLGWSIRCDVGLVWCVRMSLVRGLVGRLWT